MKRSVLATTVALVLTMSSAAIALPALQSVDADVDLVHLAPGDLPLITSDNVTYHGTIPIDSPGVGGEVVVRDDLDGQRFFYATGGKGLSIYDIADPALPILVGHLPLAHSQNEDLKVSDDGTRAVIAADGGLLLVNPVTTGIHVVDTSDPTDPTLVATSSPLISGDGTGTGTNEHTAECANADCSVIYGRTGRIYQVDEDAGVVEEIGRWNHYVDEDGVEQTVGGIHALNRDETGLIISDSNPRLVLDPGVGHWEHSTSETATPENPEVLAIGFRDQFQDGRLQHNNVRVDAEAWTSRDLDDPADAVETVNVSDRDTAGSFHVSMVDDRPVMRAGELMLGNSETNLNNACSNAGGLSTWSMVNFDHGVEMVQLEVFRPFNGNWVEEGRPARNALGCSGHWFTVSDDFVAASWYEHGVRFFEIDREIGTIDEVGYFQPIATEAGAAYWIDDEFVYSVDYARGIDIVSFDREAATPDADELEQSWLLHADRVGALAQAERYFCALAAED